MLQEILLQHCDTSPSKMKNCQKAIKILLLKKYRSSWTKFQVRLKIVISSLQIKQLGVKLFLHVVTNMGHFRNPLDGFISYINLLSVSP